jgi:hypothetical protein
MMRFLSHTSFYAGGAKRGLLLALGVLFLTVGALNGAASTAPADYTGRYEMADTKAGRAFLLNVAQNGSRATVSFSAAMSDGDGAAPQASGKGRIRHGVLTFAFKDSFNNEGDCTLTPGEKGYALSMTLTKVAEPKPLHFYGDMLLKRVSP